MVDEDGNLSAAQKINRENVAVQHFFNEKGSERSAFLHRGHPEMISLSRQHRLPLISVVICTYNRAELLDKAIQSVIQQDVPRDEFEIIIVDNGSTDETPKVVASYFDWAPVRYVAEPNVGLCVARNTGWRAARGQYIVYFDDDAIALPGWLYAVYDGFRVATDCIGVIGGRVDPIWEKPRPSWLTDEFVPMLTVVNWAPSDKVLHKILDDSAPQWLAGANMAVPKKLLEKVNGFHPALDRVGYNLLSNGDLYLQREIMRYGYHCLYRPSMAIRHLVPGSRLNQRWFYARNYYQGLSDAVMFLLEKRPSTPERIVALYERGEQFAPPPAKMPALLETVDTRDVFVEKCRSLSKLGYVAGLLGLGEL